MDFTKSNFIIKSIDVNRPVALTFVDVHGNYDIAPLNVANLKDGTICRWSTGLGAVRALDRVKANNPAGAALLHVGRILQAGEHGELDIRHYLG